MTLRAYPNRLTGFGLTEVLIGMLIGSLTILAIMQVMTNFEGQKRTTSYTSDTQVNGAIALYTIQRMAQSAGADLPTYSQTYRPLGCSTEPTTGTAPVIGIFPIEIGDGGTGPGASDTITIRGNLTPPTNGSLTGQSFAGLPNPIINMSGTTLTLNTNLGCATGDYALTMQSSTVSANPTCTLSQVTGIIGTTQVAISNAAGVSIGDGLSCLKNWANSQLVYSVNNNALLENANTIAPNVVQIQAQYGLSDTANSNTITGWVDATGQWATPSVANRKLIKAIHVALIVKDGVIQKTAVSTQCSSYDGTSVTPATDVCAWTGSVTSPAPIVDLSNIPNWQYYRYRVFETVIPLRNLIWGMNTL